MLPALFSLLKIALAIPGLLWFHIHFRIVFFTTSGKHGIEIFIEITVNLWITLSSMGS